MDQLLDVIINSGKTDVVKFICSDGIVFGPKVIFEKCEHLKTLLNSNMQESKTKEIKMEKYKMCNVKTIIKFLCYDEIDDGDTLQNDFETMDLARCWLMDNVLDKYFSMHCNNGTWLRNQLIAIQMAHEYNFLELKNKLISVVSDKLFKHDVDYDEDDEKEITEALKQISHEIMAELILYRYKKKHE